MNWRDMAETTGDRGEWLLRLLFAPVDSDHVGRLAGRTRLMKGAFLLDRKLEEDFNRETDFQFESGKYGPFDKWVFEASENLERDGLLEIREQPEYEEDEYVLTEQGNSMAQEVWEDLSQDEKQLISWIKGKHLSQSLPRLLSFVYNQYPEYTENSEIA